MAKFRVGDIVDIVDLVTGDWCDIEDTLEAQRDDIYELIVTKIESIHDNYGQEYTVKLPQTNLFIGMYEDELELVRSAIPPNTTLQQYVSERLNQKTL